MIYYAKRNKLLNNNYTIDLDELKKYFYQTYKFFEDRGFFKVAYNGVTIEERYSGEQQILPPSMSPSPAIFFMNHLNGIDVLPIWEHYEDFKEEELFTIIEILYDHIGYYDYEKVQFVTGEPKSEFHLHINSLLNRYQSGYYLDENLGFIMEQPNEALKELMNTTAPESIDDPILEQINTATKMFYRFNSNEEEKKKAINILADVLEPIRYKLQELLNDEFNINKNVHDKLIFHFVNGFNIRHNDKKQFKDYSKSIWYDWMMQYYSSVIITYYRLIMQHQK